MPNKSPEKSKYRSARDLLELFRESLEGAENNKRAPDIQANLHNLVYLLDRIIAAAAHSPGQRAEGTGLGLSSDINKCFIEVKNSLESSGGQISLRDLQRGESNDLGRRLMQVVFERLLNIVSVLIKTEIKKKNPNLFDYVFAVGLEERKYKKLWASKEPKDEARYLKLDDDFFRTKLIKVYPQRHMAIHSVEDYVVEPEDALALILFVIHINEKQIREALRNYITRTVSFDDLGGIKEEYLPHRRKWKGRAEMDSLIRKIESLCDSSDAGKYILIENDGGYGKSALVCALAERFNTGDIFGEGSKDIRNHCPWVPGILLHLIRNGGGNDQEICNSLLAQANSMLLDEIEFDKENLNSSHSLYYESDQNAPSSDKGNPSSLSVYHKFYDGKIGRLEPEPQIIEQAKGSAKEYAGRKWNELLQDHASFTKEKKDSSQAYLPDSEYSPLKVSKCIYRILQKLCLEHGKICVAIDALDELDHEHQDLNFLPPALPAGCVVLLTTKDVHGIPAHCTLKLQAERFAINELTPEIVAKIKCLDLGKDSNKINKIIKRTGGNARRIVDGGDEETDQDFFYSQYEEWKDADNPWLESVVEFLAMFSPVGTLSVEQIQEYLMNVHTGFDLSGKQLSTLLESKQTINGVKGAKIKLNLPEFADYILSSLTKFDRNNLSKKICNYFSSPDVEVKINQMSKLLRTWTRGSFNSFNKNEVAFLELPNQMLKSHPGRLKEWAKVEFSTEFSGSSLVLEKLLNAVLELPSTELPLPNHEIAQALHGNNSAFGKDVESERIIIQQAIDEGDTNAMRWLGQMLVRGDTDLGKDLEAGRGYFQQAVDAGDTDAMQWLGLTLIDGDTDLGQDLEAGRGYVQQAVVEGNTTAMQRLGVKLIYGDTDLGQDLEAGRGYFQQAVDAGDTNSMKILGVMLVVGFTDLGKDLEAGRGYVQQAVDAGDTNAMQWLGQMLVRGDTDLVKDLEAGRGYLQQAVDAGDTNAMQWLGQMLVRGDTDLGKDLEAGRGYVQQAVDAGETKAMAILGQMLINGDTDLGKDLEAGRGYVQQAVDAGDTNAMQWLGLMLVRGRDLGKDVEAGRGYWQQAVDAGDTNAMRWLGEALIDGDTDLGQDLEAGRGYFQQAVDAGDTKAMRWLGQTLIDGDTDLGKDLEAGRGYMQQAVDAGDTDEMRWLGQTLIDGDTDLGKDLEAGRGYVQQAVDAGDTNAMQWLGQMLVVGFTDLGKDLEAGRGYVQQAVDAGDTNAMLWLGLMLVRGTDLGQDLEAGRGYVQQAVDAGDTNAMRWLGQTLINGETDLGQDLEAGRGYVQQAVDAGDTNAMRWLGQTLINGETDLGQDLEAGRGYVQQAVDAGDTDAMRWLGQTLIDGDTDLGQDLEAGRGYMQQAADAGDTNATLWLGQTLILGGTDLGQDLEAGRGYVQQAVDARDTNATNAMRWLGEALIDGDTDLGQDLEAGRGYFQQAVDAGDTNAMRWLGRALIQGYTDLGQNPELGEIYLRLYYKSNSDAGFILGRQLHSGAILKRNKQEGLKIQRRAASGNNGGDSYLSVCYSKGLFGFTKSRKNTIYHLKRAQLSLAADHREIFRQFDSFEFYTEENQTKFMGGVRSVIHLILREAAPDMKIACCLYLTDRFSAEDEVLNILREVIQSLNSSGSTTYQEVYIDNLEMFSRLDALVKILSMHSLWNGPNSLGPDDLRSFLHLFRDEKLATFLLDILASKEPDLHSCLSYETDNSTAMYWIARSHDVFREPILQLVSQIKDREFLRFPSPLVYLKRRDEYRGEVQDTVVALLSSPRATIRRRSTESLLEINEILYKLEKVKSKRNWDLLNNFFFVNSKTVRQYVEDFWSKLALVGDSEGYLVLWFLWRYSLIKTSDLPHGIMLNKVKEIVKDEWDPPFDINKQIDKNSG